MLRFWTTDTSKIQPFALVELIPEVCNNLRLCTKESFVAPSSGLPRALALTFQEVKAKFLEFLCSRKWNVHHVVGVLEQPKQAKPNNGRQQKMRYEMWHDPEDPEEQTSANSEEISDVHGDLGDQHGEVVDYHGHERGVVAAGVVELWRNRSR